jgi:hypothetical protein
MSAFLVFVLKSLKPKEDFKNAGTVMGAVDEAAGSADTSI